ncbi:hypothetical protein BP6252_06233 [Coleophoma cylindrospora]|uniref:Uncharacterized protein n=1 Tax=Coleophoma cylindrospora TaxID=1849047 RepID=A0A3D8RMR8_9HELO|nr:hypothetical protein BP6252_06233 [Coleophoma cylindrospora]
MNRLSPPRHFLKAISPTPLPRLTSAFATSARSSSQPKLSNKRVLITGASRGIGKAIASRFAAEGGQCVLVGRKKEGLEDVRRELSVEGLGAGMGHQVLVGDVATARFPRPNEVNSLAKQKTHGLKQAFQEIDILVNAAGITHYSLLATTKQQLLEEVVQTNLMGTLYGCKVALKGMLRGKRGDASIINIASLLGMKGGRGNAAYAASKAGVIGLTRALAAELGPSGIRVNVIIPGYIETDMTKAMTPEAHSQALNSIPLKRFGEAEEIADAAVFLATNRYANNCVLNIDGGLSAT